MDKSDENECKIVSMEDAYNKKIPPFNKDNKARVNVSIILLSINRIRKDIKSSFMISIQQPKHGYVSIKDRTHKPLQSFLF